MRVLPPRLFLAFAAVMLLAWVVAREPAVLPAPFGWAGIAVAGVGAVLNIAAGLRIHRAGTTIKPFDEPAVLITDSLFRFSRNPVYLGFVLMLLGLAMLLNSAVSFVLTLVFAVVLDRCYIRAEEAAMLRVFGSAYVAYQARVRRWL